MSPVNTQKTTTTKPFQRIPAKWFSDIVSRIESVTNSDEVYKLLIEISQNLGISYITYGTNVCTSFTYQTIFVLSNNSSEWRNHYEENRLVAHDPRIVRAKRSATPFVWSKINPETKKEQQVLDDLQTFGIAEGITFPVRNARNDFGFINTAFIEPQKKMSSRLGYITPYMQLLANYIHEKTYSLLAKEHQAENPGTTPLDVRLTDRERECLIWLAEGKTSWEISQILEITESTVNQHLHSAGRKLKSNNRTHTIAKAISLKFIAPNYKKKIELRYLHK